MRDFFAGSETERSNFFSVGLDDFRFLFGAFFFVCADRMNTCRFTPIATLCSVHLPAHTTLRHTFSNNTHPVSPTYLFLIICQKYAEGELKLEVSSFYVSAFDRFSVSQNLFFFAQKKVSNIGKLK